MYDSKSITRQQYVINIKEVNDSINDSDAAMVQFLSEHGLLDLKALGNSTLEEEPEENRVPILVSNDFHKAYKRDDITMDDEARHTELRLKIYNKMQSNSKFRDDITEAYSEYAMKTNKSESKPAKPVIMVLRDSEIFTNEDSVNYWKMKKL